MEGWIPSAKNAFAAAPILAPGSSAPIAQWNWQGIPAWASPWGFSFNGGSAFVLERSSGDSNVQPGLLETSAWMPGLSVGAWAQSLHISPVCTPLSPWPLPIFLFLQHPEFPCASRSPLRGFEVHATPTCVLTFIQVNHPGVRAQGLYGERKLRDPLGQRSHPHRDAVTYSFLFK